MVRDDLLTCALLLAFATLITTHLSLVAGLTRHPPWWRALVALVAVPLAPYWGRTAHMKGRASLWVMSAVAYVVLRLLAARVA
jgi:hypothetical protein